MFRLVMINQRKIVEFNESLHVDDLNILHVILYIYVTRLIGTYNDKI